MRLSSGPSSSVTCPLRGSVPGARLTGADDVSLVRLTELPPGSPVAVVVRQLTEHVQGDMRTLDLGRTFDVVLAHDAIDYMLGVKVEELYREIRALRIYEGASEVQKIVIARDLLKTGP